MLFASLHFIACASGPESKPQKLRGKSASLPFLLQIPYNYDHESNKSYPLLVFLHGRGEQGVDLQKVVVEGTPPFHYDHYPVLNRNFILLSPQLSREFYYWPPKLLSNLIQQVSKQYRVDPGRIYLTGLSMGGIGGWELLLESPELFAAAALFAGVPKEMIENPGKKKPRVSKKRVELPSSYAVSNLRSIAFLAIHCEDDPIIPARGSEQMVSALREIGNVRAHKIIRQGCGHGAWSKVYQRKMPILRKQDLYYWFLQFSKHD